MEKISLSKLIKNDYLIFLSLASMIGISLFILFINYFDTMPYIKAWLQGKSPLTHDFKIGLSLGCGGVILVLLFLFLQRIFYIRSILHSGYKTWAKVVLLEFYHDKGYVGFTYDIHDKAYQSVSSIVKNRMTKCIHHNDLLQIAVDEKNPTDAILMCLYED